MHRGNPCCLSGCRLPLKTRSGNSSGSYKKKLEKPQKPSRPAEKLRAAGCQQGTPAVATAVALFYGVCTMHGVQTPHIKPRKSSLCLFMCHAASWVISRHSQAKCLEFELTVSWADIDLIWVLTLLFNMLKDVVPILKYSQRSAFLMNKYFDIAATLRSYWYPALLDASHKHAARGPHMFLVWNRSYCENNQVWEEKASTYFFHTHTCFL